MSSILYFAFLILASVALFLSFRARRRQVPVSVNYFITRRCNRTCVFCFHTAKTSYMEESGKAKKGLQLLKNAGMRKINFAGGEPFLYAKFLGEMVDFCKQNLRLESVSIITNGSLVRENFFKEHGQNLDILAVSCDSFDEATNIKIGRGSGDQVPQLYQIASWCKKYNVKFKINTVVCSLNHMEDMNEHISTFQPFRWKCFQVLVQPGENDTTNTLRDARKFIVKDEEFENFCQRHKGQKSLVPESNRVMRQSYLLLDEYMRFIDKDGNKTSDSILQIGVQKALEAIRWDEEAFLERGGIYDWTQEKTACSEVKVPEW